MYERTHRPLKRDAAIPPETTLRAQQPRSTRLREKSNEERPREAHEKESRAVRAFQARAIPTRLECHESLGKYQVRRASRCGTIRAFKNQVIVSHAPLGDTVRPGAVAVGMCDLCICLHPIGR